MTDPEPNLKRWKLSGEPEEWVGKHLHGWNHNDWLGLLTSLRKTEYWPMEEAAIGQHLEMLRYKLMTMKNVTFGGGFHHFHGDSPLHKAARDGHQEMVELLLANGFSVHSYNEYHQTPLHEAARNGHKEVVELLLANGAWTNLPRLEESPLHEAAGHGHRDVVELLLANKAAVNRICSQLRTPLHCAAQNGHVDVAELLLAHGADANATDGRGYTPYDCAYSNVNLKSRGPAEAARLKDVQKLLRPDPPIWLS